jgi:hypothetical protein
MANPALTTSCLASASFNRHSASAVAQNLPAESTIAAATCCGDSGAHSPANSAVTLFQAISGIGRQDGLVHIDQHRAG